MIPDRFSRWLIARPAWQTHAAGAGLVLVITTLAYALQIAPLLDQDVRRIALQTEIGAHAARAEQLARDVKRTREQADAAERYVRDAHLVLHTRSSLNDQLAAITELAGQCGLQTDGIEPGAETHSLRHHTMAIRLSARGTAAQLLKFLTMLRAQMPDKPAIGVAMTASPSFGNAEASGPCTINLLWFTSGNVPVASNASERPITAATLP